MAVKQLVSSFPPLSLSHTLLGYFTKAAPTQQNGVVCAAMQRNRWAAKTSSDQRQLDASLQQSDDNNNNNNNKATNNPYNNNNCCASFLSATM